MYRTGRTRTAISIGFAVLTSLFASLSVSYFLLWIKASESNHTSVNGLWMMTDFFVNQFVMYIWLCFSFLILFVLFFPIRRFYGRNILEEIYSNTRQNVNLNESKFDPKLSGLRGLASLGVILYHIAVIPSIVFGYPFFLGGWLGVALFLMLSMYLLLKSLDTNPNLKHYFSRRIKRIWPIYYACVTAAFLVYHISMGNLVEYLTFTNYYFNPGGIGPLAIFWTLQLEEVMYIFIPLIHRSNRKSLIACGLIGINSIASGLICLVDLGYSKNISLLLPFLSALLSMISKNQSSQVYWFPVWLGAYGFGLLAYLYKDAFPQKLVWIVPFILISVPFIVLLGVNDLNFIFRQIVYFSILPGFAAFLVHPPKFLTKFTLLGEESYAMYALQYFFLYPFGLIGVPMILVTSFEIELSLRPKLIIARLKSVYFPEKRTRESIQSILLHNRRNFAKGS